MLDVVPFELWYVAYTSDGVYGSKFVLGACIRGSFLLAGLYLIYWLDRFCPSNFGFLEKTESVLSDDTDSLIDMAMS